MKALLTKKNKFEEEKSKIIYIYIYIYIRNQLDFVERLIEFMKVLIAIKIYFSVNLGFN
jgi:hypothetical protein